MPGDTALIMLFAAVTLTVRCPVDIARKTIVSGGITFAA